MKIFSAFLGPILFLLVTTNSISQEDLPTAGFVEVVNLISSESPTYLAIKDFELNRGDPVAPGYTSGLLTIIPGNYPLKVSNEAMDPKSLTIDLPVEHEKTSIAICYDEIDPESDREEPRSRLRINLLTDSFADGDDPRVSIVSLLNDPIVNVVVGNQTFLLEPQQATQVPSALGSSISAKINGRSLGEAQSIKRPVHHIGFIYYDPETELPAISWVMSEKLTYSPSSKSDSTDSSSSEDTSASEDPPEGTNPPAE